MSAFLRSCRELLCFGCTVILIVAEMVSLWPLGLGLSLLWTPHVLLGKRLLLGFVLLCLVGAMAAWVLKRWEPESYFDAEC